MDTPLLLTVIVGIGIYCWMRRRGLNSGDALMAVFCELLRSDQIMFPSKLCQD